MTDRIIFVLTFASALGSGLVAGIFFAFSAFVMSALGRIPPTQGISAMQSINIVVINPVFFSAFFGTAALCCVLGLASFSRWAEPGAPYLLAGSLLYLIGCIGVTMAYNVPLNTALAVVTPESTEGASLWTRYLSQWTTWNTVRTIASLAASAAFIAALL